jgi:hypothetical protein
MASILFHAIFSSCELFHASERSEVAKLKGKNLKQSFAKQNSTSARICKIKRASFAFCENLRDLRETELRLFMQSGKESFRSFGRRKEIF